MLYLFLIALADIERLLFSTIRIEFVRPVALEVDGIDQDEAETKKIFEDLQSTYRVVASSMSGWMRSWILSWVASSTKPLIF